MSRMFTSIFYLIAPKYADVRDIVNALDEVDAIVPDKIPSDAMIREFIGGSSLHY